MLKASNSERDITATSFGVISSSTSSCYATLHNQSKAGRERAPVCLRGGGMILCKGHDSFCQCVFVTGLTFVRELKTALIPYVTFECAAVLLN